MVLRQILPWQMNSTFICSFISSQILSNARKYWVCGFFHFFDTFSYLLILNHIFSVAGYKIGYKIKNLYPGIFKPYASFSSNIPSLSISSHASSAFIWVYVSRVTEMSPCPMMYCNTFGFIPDFARFVQQVCLHTCGVIFGICTL